MRISPRLVVVLAALSAFGPLSIDFYLPGLPRLTSDFDAGASVGQVTLTACLLGLAVGQLFVGPLSDRLGRRPPVFAGLVLYCAASLACAAAQSIWVLVALRLVQGLSGSAGIVVARSVVRDLVEGVEAARLYSILMAMLGIVPILAPILGGAFLHVTSWRGLFVILAAVDAGILAATWRWLPETLPADRRRKPGTVGIGFLDLLRDRFFAAYAVVMGLGFAAMFSYIAGSSFVLEDLHGVSAQAYGVIFGVNALGIVAASQLNRALVGRASPRQLLAAGVTAQAASGIGVLAVVLVGGAGLPGLLPCLFVSVASIGLIVPNATALALTDYPHAAGKASALLGMLQFAFGALAAPLVGIAGRGTAVPMALLMAAFGVGALVTLAVASSRLGRGGPMTVPGSVEAAAAPSAPGGRGG
jgi:MFS transporter, DHA1 family, multidrug resistance protein